MKSIAGLTKTLALTILLALNSWPAFLGAQELSPEERAEYLKNDVTPEIIVLMIHDAVGPQRLRSMGTDERWSFLTQRTHDIKLLDQQGTRRLDLLHEVVGDIRNEVEQRKTILAPLEIEAAYRRRVDMVSSRVRSKDPEQQFEDWMSGEVISHGQVDEDYRWLAIQRVKQVLDRLDSDNTDDVERVGDIFAYLSLESENPDGLIDVWKEHYPKWSTSLEQARVEARTMISSRDANQAKRTLKRRSDSAGRWIVANRLMVGVHLDDVDHAHWKQQKADAKKRATREESVRRYDAKQASYVLAEAARRQGESADAFLASYRAGYPDDAEVAELAALHLSAHREGTLSAARMCELWWQSGLSTTIAWVQHSNSASRFFAIDDRVVRNMEFLRRVDECLAKHGAEATSDKFIRVAIESRTGHQLAAAIPDEARAFYIEHQRPGEALHETVARVGRELRAKSTHYARSVGKARPRIRGK